MRDKDEDGKPLTVEEKLALLDIEIRSSTSRSAG
jgi:hypothetical protein